MKSRLINLLLIPVFIGCMGTLAAQNSNALSRKIDSIKRVTQSKVHDTLRLEAYKDWDNLIYVSDAPLDFRLNCIIDSISSKNLKKKNLKAKERRYYLRSRSFALNNMGIYYQIQGNNAKAITCYTQCLSMSETLNDKNQIASALGNIGIVYKEMKEVDKAIEFYEKGLKIRLEMKDDKGIAAAYTNLGIVYLNKGQYEKAMQYQQNALELRQKLNDLQGVATSYNNIGAIYKNKGEYNKAIENYKKSLAIRESMNDLYGIAASNSSLAILYNRLNDYGKAIAYAQRTLALAQKGNIKDKIRDGADILYQAYKKTGNYSKSLEMFELYVQTRDSINSEENHKEVIRQQFKYNYEKQAAADSVANAKQQEIKNAEIAKHKAEIKAKRNQQYLLFGGLGLVLVFALFMYNRFKVTARQKKEIEEQKLLVEEKQKEILDSIRYAKRIQMALLPGEKYIEKSIKVK